MGESQPKKRVEINHRGEQGRDESEKAKKLSCSFHPLSGMGSGGDTLNAAAVMGPLAYSGAL